MQDTLRKPRSIAGDAMPSPARASMRRSIADAA